MPNELPDTLYRAPGAARSRPGRHRALRHSRHHPHGARRRRGAAPSAPVLARCTPRRRALRSRQQRRRRLSPRPARGRRRTRSGPRNGGFPGASSRRCAGGRPALQGGGNRAGGGSAGSFPFRRGGGRAARHGPRPGGGRRLRARDRADQPVRASRAVSRRAFRSAERHRSPARRSRAGYLDHHLHRTQAGVVYRGGTAPRGPGGLRQSPGARGGVCRRGAERTPHSAGAVPQRPAAPAASRPTRGTSATSSSSGGTKGCRARRASPRKRPRAAEPGW